MSYEKALIAAGAKMIAFKEFGSYQGEWYALVEYNGERGWVSGGYGSCSACDAFEGEIGHESVDAVGEQIWDRSQGEYRDATEADVAEWQNKIAAFGKTYLDGLMTQEQAERAASEGWAYGCEDGEIITFVKSNPV